MMPESSPLLQRRNRTPGIDMSSKSMSNPIFSRVEQQIMITQHVLVIPHKSTSEASVARSCPPDPTHVASTTYGESLGCFS